MRSVHLIIFSLSGPLERHKKHTKGGLQVCQFLLSLRNWNKSMFLIEMWLLSSKAVGEQNASISVKLMRFSWVSVVYIWNLVTYLWPLSNQAVRRVPGNGIWFWISNTGFVSWLQCCSATGFMCYSHTSLWH